jgi:membrane protein
VLSALQTAAVVKLVAVFDFVLSLSVTATLFTLIFRFMPARRLEWRWALWGGLLTTALFKLGRWLIGPYLAHSTAPSAFGAAASFAALFLWIYYTAQIFLFGAEFTPCLGGLRDATPDGDPKRPAQERTGPAQHANQRFEADSA